MHTRRTPRLRADQSRATSSCSSCSASVRGALIAGIALGIVLNYRGSGVINIGMGALALLGAYVFYGLRTGGYVFLSQLDLGVAVRDGLGLPADDGRDGRRRPWFDFFVLRKLRTASPAGEARRFGRIVADDPGSGGPAVRRKRSRRSRGAPERRLGRDLRHEHPVGPLRAHRHRSRRRGRALCDVPMDEVRGRHPRRGGKRVGGRTRGSLAEPYLDRQHDSRQHARRRTRRARRSFAQLDP